MRRIQLRVAIMTLVTALVTLSPLVVGTILGRSNFELADQLQKREAEVIFGSAQTELVTTFGRAPDLLRKYTRHFEKRSVDPMDHKVLGAYLASEIASEPSLTWISFGYAGDGSFVGATRRDGQIIINKSIRDEDQGATREWVLARDGTVSPSKAANPAPYDSREHDWFRQGLRTDEVSWTKPYRFQEGGYGITSMLRISKRGTTRPIGVMTIDFNMSSMTETLAQISREYPGKLLLRLENSEDVFLSEAGLPATLQERVRTMSALHDEQGGSRTVRTAFEHEGAAYFIYDRPIDIVEGQPASLLYVVQQSLTPYGIIYRKTVLGIIVTAVFLFLAIVAAFGVSRSISGPIESMGRKAAKISVDNLDEYEGMGRHWLVEVDETARSFDNMIERLNKAEEVRSSFGRYLPDALAKALEQGALNIELGGYETQITALFTDIEGFTTLSEQLSSKRMIGYLNRYFAIVLEEIERHDGMIIDFIGDGLFAAFGAPVQRDDHRDLGIACALKLIERTEAFQQELAAEGISWGRTRMGLHSGRVIAGNVGGPGRQKYTALGDVVNAAARIESLNKQLGTRMLASADTARKSCHSQKWRSAGKFVMVGKSKPIELFEAIGTEFDGDRLSAFTDCMAACDDAAAAVSRFKAYLEKYGADSVASFHAERVAHGELGDVVTLVRK